MVVKGVSELVESVLNETEIELVDVEYVSERGRWVLRIYLDKAGGITLDDCARVSREIGDLIEVKDIVQHDYVLEVSSPGISRPLKKEKDFLGAMGKKVKVKMVIPVDGRRNFTGYLRDLREGMLHFEVDGISVILPLRDVEKANLVYEFNK